MDLNNKYYNYFQNAGKKPGRLVKITDNIDKILKETNIEPYKEKYNNKTLSSSPVNVTELINKFFNKYADIVLLDVSDIESKSYSNNVNFVNIGKDKIRKIIEASKNINLHLTLND
tara:strand:- start:136 stop:483 length:348 start_codon:yes stop_codon:yes gene_type:complete